MTEKYKNLDEEKETSISNGPALNAVPYTNVVEGQICGIFKKPRWCQDGFKVLVASVVVFATTVAIALCIDIALRNNLKLIEVVTDNDQCTRLVKGLFKKTEANAVDAAIAGMFCLAVTRPDHASLASGGFMVYHSKEKSGVIDFQYTATRDSLRQNSSLVALPGFVPGLMEAHRMYGSIKWSRVLAPSVSLAKNGFIVEKHLARNIKKYAPRFSSKMKKMFSHPNGALFKLGDVMKMEKLADILSFIAKDDIQPYQQDLKRKIKFWNENDFQSYIVRRRRPLKLKFDNIVLLTSSFPSAGVSALLTLNTLQHVLPHTSLLKHYHSLAETLKEINENHTFILEEPFKQNMSYQQVKEHISKVQSPQYALDLAGKIRTIISSDEDRQTATGKQPTVSDAATAKVLVIDHDGESVSMASSLGHVFGSMDVTDSGVVLNNGMAFFPEGWQYNEEETNRPISYTSPVIGFRRNRRDESERFVFAASSDKKGLSALGQVLSSIFFANMDVSLATINETRLYFDVEVGQLSYEGDRDKSDKVRSLSSQLNRYYGPGIVEVKEPIGHVFLAKRSEEKGKSLRDTRCLI